MINSFTRPSINDVFDNDLPSFSQHLLRHELSNTGFPAVLTGINRTVGVNEPACSVLKQVRVI